MGRNLLQSGSEGVVDPPWGGSLIPVGLKPLPLHVTSLTQVIQKRQGSLNPDNQALVILPLQFSGATKKYPHW